MTETEESAVRITGVIKQPFNAFAIFMRNERKRMASVNPDWSNAQVAKVGHVIWSKLSNADKIPFIQEARGLSAQHSECIFKPRKKLKNLPVPPDRWNDYKQHGGHEND